MSPCFPSPAEVINLVRRFSSLIMCGRNFECVQTFSGYTINLSAVLIRHGQYEAAQVLYFVFGLKFIRNIHFIWVLLYLYSINYQISSPYPQFLSLTESAGNSGNILEQWKSIPYWSRCRYCMFSIPSSQWILPSDACTWWSKYYFERIQGSWCYPMLFQVLPFHYVNLWIEPFLLSSNDTFLETVFSGWGQQWFIFLLWYWRRNI